MFTLKFKERNQDYKAFSVVNYHVSRDDSGNAEVTMSRKLNGQDHFSEYVGEEETYDICFVTNSDGKTIDVIKRIEKRNA